MKTLIFGLILIVSALAQTIYINTTPHAPTCAQLKTQGVWDVDMPDKCMPPAIEGVF